MTIISQNAKPSATPNSNDSPRTWLDAVDDGEEGVSVPPTLAEIVDEDAELLSDLVLAPVQQRLPRAHLPFLLDADAARGVGARLGRAALVEGRAAVALAEALEDARVLLDLEEEVRGFKNDFINSHIGSRKFKVTEVQCRLIPNEMITYM